MRLNTLIRQLLLFTLTGTAIAGSALLTNPGARAAPAEEVSLTVYETELNEYGNPYELNSAADGSLWVSDNGAGEIRHYSVDGDSLVIYSGLGAVSDARPAPDGTVWFVDQDTANLSRLDTSPGLEAVQFWALPGGSTAGFGTALDGQGRIWVSDASQAKLFSFDPDSPDVNVCTYDTSALAISGSPYITFDGAKLWFSSINHNTILRLDPSTLELSKWTGTDDPWNPVPESFTGDGTGGLWFADSTGYLVHLDLTDPEAAQFERFRVPGGGGKPYMLGRQDQQVWYSGQEPGTLGMLLPDMASNTASSPVYATATLTSECVQIDPVSGPPVTVSAPGEPVWTPVQYTASDPSPGWMLLALGAESFPWGIHMAGNRLWAVDNGRSMLLRADVVAEVTACKLQDGDNDLATTDDQTPLASWGMTLNMDGGALNTALTGADGCVSWAGLELGRAYSVQEEQRSGWLALSPETGLCELGVPGLPGEHTCEFINAQGLSAIFLPLVMRPVLPTE